MNQKTLLKLEYDKIINLLADQVIFMDGGIIVEQGDARQVIEHPREERTRQFLSRYEESSVSGQ